MTRDDEPTPGRGLAVHEVLIEHLTDAVKELTREVRGLRTGLETSERARLTLEGRVGALEERPSCKTHHDTDRFSRRSRIPWQVWHAITLVLGAIAGAISAHWIH